MTIYELSRNFWDFAFENPSKIKPAHCAIYFFAIEHCNRLGWKREFGFPASMVIEAIGVKSYGLYKKTLDDLIEFGFIKIIQYSKNQYSSNIIALTSNIKAQSKALDKALSKHSLKHSQSIVSIDIQEETNIPITNKQETNKQNFLLIFSEAEKPIIEKWINFRKEIKKPLTKSSIESLKQTIEKKGLNYLKQQIENSIKSGWQGLFELKQNNENNDIPLNPRPIV